ncbi:MAG: hypothetical protein CMD90_01475 [Gammaproteobacteria bacterium]|nr:hypothetical protein [Gammaproteobacteria bacterium]|tara:strand:- start:1417 stop:2376 length:960 start_codon:yes stop_codon:yes gene_type:complete
MNRENDFNTFYFSHGRTALKFGLLGLKIKQGKEILLPDYICDSVLYPIEDLKLRPVFYSTSEDLTPEWNVLEDKITSKTAAIVMVNFFGQPQEINKFINLAREKNIYLIEDNAHGYGGYFDKRLLGTFGDIGISSPRKFLDINCGGILYTKKDLIINLNEIKEMEVKSRSKVKRLINRFPKLKKRLVKTFKSRPVYEKQETFAEDKINDYLIDKDSLDIVLSQNIRSFAMKRREKYLYWEKFSSRRGLKPVFKSIYAETNPWCFPAYARSQKEAIELFDWGWKNGVAVFSWPTLPEQMRKNPSAVLERWKRMVCFSTSF